MSCPQCGCSTVEVTNIPGLKGDPGLDGDNGINSFTITTSALVVPAATGDTVTALVATSEWMSIGQVVIVSDGTNHANFSVLSFPSTSAALLQWLNYTGDAAPGTSINIGATVSPAGLKGSLSAALPNAITDNSGGTASDTINVGAQEQILTFPLASLVTSLGAGAVTILNAYKPGFAFQILQLDFVNTVAGTGAGASQTFSAAISGVAVTGGTVNPTLASTGTYGNVTLGTAVTAANVGGSTDSISINMSAGGTAFTAGSGYFVMRLKNLDSANALASLADHINDLITALT